jgi:hypothetical protein
VSFVKIELDWLSKRAGGYLMVQCEVLIKLCLCLVWLLRKFCGKKISLSAQVLTTEFY